MTDDFLPVLPVSVVELGAQGKRPPGGHDTKSSRSAYSGFPEEAVELAYSLFLRESRIIYDPFAGWGERGAGAYRYARTYLGNDTSTAAVEANRKLGVGITLADARYIPAPYHDGLFTCPPYWNLERYEADGGLDRLATWPGFLSALAGVWSRAIPAMKAGGTAVVVVGDWRKDGRYYDLTYRTERALESAGMVPFDKVVLSRRTVTKIKIMLPQAKRLGYTVRCHETMLVYRKPVDP